MWYVKRPEVVLKAEFSVLKNKFMRTGSSRGRYKSNRWALSATPWLEYG